MASLSLRKLVLCLLMFVLMAGAARVQVPIRNGMEEYFAWFLKTGQIWGASGIPPISGDDEYVSMIQELKESKQGDYTGAEVTVVGPPMTGEGSVEDLHIPRL